jgi:hypothetical protein
MAPKAISISASGATPYEAHLEATVDAGEETTECHFLYGKTSTTEHEEECEQGDALEGGEQSVGRTITGLEPATTYHYRIVVKNATSQSESEAEFETLALVKPAITSESASQITAFTAHLEATVNPDYQTTTCAFEYRKEGSSSFAPPVECEQGNALEGGEQGASAKLGALEAGSAYEYRLVAENASGQATGAPDRFETAGSPLVSTGETASITQTAATLSGTVNPDGAQTSYHIAYISEAGYRVALAHGAANPYAEGETTPTFTAGSSTEAQAVGPISASGLLAGTTYHYALVATNEAGESVGADHSFTTLAPAPPLVSTDAATAVSQTTATISGTVATIGLATTYGFEVGTEAGNYGPVTGLGSISSPSGETVTLTLSGLQPSTTYFYRIVAMSIDGTSYGSSQSFTTSRLPYLLTIPATPALITAPASVPAAEKAPSEPPNKPLTRAQKLRKALKACRADKSSTRRLKCEKVAKRKYAPATKHAGKK